MADNTVKISVELDENGVTSGVKDINSEMKNLDDASSNAASGGISSLSVAFGNLASQAISAAIEKVQEFCGEVLSVGMDFESSMSKVEALSGATEEELAELTETAKYWGSTTRFSATECADALSYMALAGWDAEQSAAALPGVLNLAATADMDLAQASDLVTDYLSAFGMQAEDASYFADMLAYAQANSNTNVENLGAAYGNCAASMTAFGQDAETTTAILGTLADNGKKGSDAGTTLKNIMKSLSSEMENGTVQFGNANIEVVDSEGNYRNLIDILIDMQAEYDGMTQEAGSLAVQDLFLTSCQEGVNILLQSGLEECKEFEGELYSCNGTAEKMANIMNDNLEGDLASLNSAFEGVCNEIYEDFSPALRDGVQAVTAVLNGDWDEAFSLAGQAVGEFGEGIWDLIDGVFPGAKEGFKGFCDDVGGFFEDVGEGFETVWNGVCEFFEDPIGNIEKTWDEFTEGVSQTLDEWGVTQAFEDMWNGVCEFFDDPIGTIESTWNDFTEGVSAKLDEWGVTEAFEGIWDGLATFFDDPIGTISNAWDDFTTGVSNKLDEWGITETFEGIWNDVSSGVSEWWDGITGDLRDWWGGAQESADKFFSGVGETISGVWSSIKSGVSEWWNDITGNLRDWWGGVQESAGSFFGGVGETISGAWETVSTGVSEWWGGITEDVGEWWDGVTEKADEVFTGIGETINGAWESVSGGVSEWWSGITEDLGEWWDGVVETADGIWETVSGGVEEAWDTISTGASEAWDGITGTLSEAWDGIVEVGDTVWNNVTEGVSGAWDTICGWFGWGSKETEEEYEECLDNIVSETDNWGVDDAFESKMEETEQEMHRSAGQIEQAYDECCADIEAMTSGIDIELDDILLPHIEYTLIDVPLIGTIPDPDNLYTNWYKTGAIATGPSVVGIGEAGNEAIVPLSGSMMQPFAEAVAEGISNTGRGDIYITINMDHVNAGRDDIKELAEELSQELGARVRRELARQGVRS